MSLSHVYINNNNQFLVFLGFHETFKDQTYILISHPHRNLYVLLIFWIKYWTYQIHDKECRASLCSSVEANTYCYSICFALTRSESVFNTCDLTQKLHDCLIHISLNIACMVYGYGWWLNWLTRWQRDRGRPYMLAEVSNFTFTPTCMFTQISQNSISLSLSLSLFRFSLSRICSFPSILELTLAFGRPCNRYNSYQNRKHSIQFDAISGFIENGIWNMSNIAFYQHHTPISTSAQFHPFHILAPKSSNHPTVYWWNIIIIIMYKYVIAVFVIIGTHNVCILFVCVWECAMVTWRKSEPTFLVMLINLI